MNQKRAFILLFSCLFAASVFAQNAKLAYSVKILPADSVIYLLNLSSSQFVQLAVKGQELMPSSYRLDRQKLTITLLIPNSDSITIKVYNFPEVFTKSYAHKDIELIKSDKNPILNPFAFGPSDSRSELASFGNLNKAGSISRGVTVGNTQDLGINSSLNLQLSGKLSDDIEVIAAISDDNIPIQPEGNTQQIQDFDRVYIQLINNKNNLIAGDFELKRPNAYFLNYFKKVKGASAFTEQRVAANSLIKTTAAIAVAKGKYARQVVISKEGNQGPYRLKGNNNEQFIIVLAGTERVFIDGELLRRGENLDYTLDYNSAEITFTARRPINAFSRIIVEYEYSERNYARTLSIFNSEFISPKWNLKLNYYNEQDSKNRPLLQDLNNEQKLLLSTVGDNNTAAYFTTVDSVGYNADQIRYKKIDSLGFVVYQYSTNQELAIYQLAFSELGNKLGNYIQFSSTANGRVFQWVAPINGVPQGNFEPVQLLVSPKKSEMVTFAVDHQISKNWKFSNETAISNVDLNLYSTKDDADNIGLASKSYLSNNTRLNSDSNVHLVLKSQISFEFVDQNFRAVEFYRPVEFYRDYNINTTKNAKEFWFIANTGIERNKKKIIDYRLSVFIRDTLFSGFQQQASLNLNNRNWRLTGATSLLNADFTDIASSSTFLKHKFDLSKTLKLVSIGISEETEDNRYENNANDTLGFNSFSFRDYKAYIQNPDEWTNKFRLEYSNRLDKRPYQSDLLSATLAEGINFFAERNSNANSIWNLSVNYRNLKVIRATSNLQSEENLIARIRHDGVFLNGLLTTSTFYEIGTGQEPKRNFSFIQVPIGQGLYVFNDYNKNGIKELNEFEIAKFSYEADYIRISTISNDFVRTKSTVFSESILVDPSRKWRDAKGWKKVLSIFSNQIAGKIDRKVLYNSAENIYNPFDINIIDSSLIALNTSFRNSLFINRTNPVFGIEYAIQQNSSKVILSNGFDSRFRLEHVFRLRSNFLNAYSANLEGKKGLKKSTSEYLIDRNYQIDFFEVKPELGYQFNATFRTLLSYVFGIQNNLIGLKEQAVKNVFSIESRYNASGNTNLSAKVNYIKNKYTALSNSAIAYEMLEGLQIGNNYTWNLTYQRNFGTNFQVNVIYDGRNSANAPVIHSGSIQARAYF